MHRNHIKQSVSCKGDLYPLIGGKHYSFEINHGIEIPFFFWFPNAPESVPEIASVKPDTWQTGDIFTAQDSRNHLAFTEPLEELEAYPEQLIAQEIFVTPVLHYKGDRQRSSCPKS
jgi:hypothetical protein